MFFMKFMTVPFFPDLDTLAWSAKDRGRALDQARTGTFDLVIIGGGITGAGLAREAALRRIPFLLADKEDFAFGTSSRSSKLAHGGFRYLAQGEFRLVREAATERNWLRHALPNLVRPLGFHLCARAGGKDTPARVRLGILLYDLLSNTFSRYKNLPHRFLTPDQLAAREPAVDTGDLLMAGIYYDTLVDDARLVLETLKEARDASGGRSPVLNYLRAARIAPAGERGWAVDLEDRLGGGRFTVAARCVLNATGAWTDETLRLAGVDSRMIRPTKGVHLVVPNHRIGNREAFVLRSATDGRTIFVLRRGNVSVIGTTDTDFPDSPDEPWCEGADCDYLLDTVNRAFPGARLTRRDVIATSAGIRPLVRGRDTAASAVSRRHLLLDPGTGLVTIAGGKLTTFRTMAWEVLDRCARAGYLRPLRGREAGRNFTRRPYKVGMTWEAWCRAAADLGLDRAAPEGTRRHLHQQYGSQGLRILREVGRAPAAGEPLLAGHPFCAAEVGHILAFENAPHLGDVMLRRTEMQMRVAHPRQAELAGRVAALMACHYGWDAARTREEREAYLEYVRRTVLP
jgi:glycerol-3-phosphate dehydrogenase